MVQTMKAKTSPTGYIATIQYSDARVEFPVARFDDNGDAMICDPDGTLVAAKDFPGFAQVWPMLQSSGR